VKKQIVENKCDFVSGFNLANNW